jgi:hypothetical protein
VTDDQVTAYHEAGHAVVNVALGLPFVHVTVRPYGNVYFGPAIESWTEPLLDLRYATSCMAGDAAVTLATGRRDTLAGTDHRNAARALRRVVDNEQLNVAIGYAYSFAEVLLREHWASVTPVAKELHLWGILEYSQIIGVLTTDDGTMVTAAYNDCQVTPALPGLFGSGCTGAKNLFASGRNRK